MREQFEQLEMRQRELRAGVADASAMRKSGGLRSNDSVRSSGSHGSRRSVRFSDAKGHSPDLREVAKILRLPMTPEELHDAEVEAARAKEAATTEASMAEALQRQVAELKQQLERERAHSRRMMHAQVMCPHCEEFLPAGECCEAHS